MILLQILYKEKEPVYFIFDDSSNKKRGKHISAAFKFFDYLSKTYMLGHQVVCAIIEYRGFVIPYAAEIYVPKDQTSFFKKKTKIAEEMIKIFDIDYHLKEQVFVLCDCYYATSPIINHCRKNGYILISSLKNNRIVTIDDKTRPIGEFIKDSFKKRSHKKPIELNHRKYLHYSCKAILKTGGAVKLVLTKDLSHKTVKVIFTTNTALPLTEILQAYQKRWSIEVFFKMSNQHLGFRASQSRHLEASTSSILLSMLSYNLLTHLFLKETNENSERLTSKKIAQFSVLDMRDKVRQIVNLDTIDYCIEESKDNISKNKIIKNIKSYLMAA